MGFSKSRLGSRAATAAGAFALSLALTAGVAQAQDKAIVMKITTPTLHAALDLYANQLAPTSRKIPTAGSRSKSIRRASSARFPGRSKARSSAPSSARSFRLSFLSASTNALKCWRLPVSSPPSRKARKSPAIRRCRNSTSGSAPTKDCMASPWLMPNLRR